MPIADPVYERPKREDCVFTHKAIEFGAWHLMVCSYRNKNVPAGELPA